MKALIVPLHSKSEKNKNLSYNVAYKNKNKIICKRLIKLNIQKTKIMASGLIMGNNWGNIVSWGQIGEALSDGEAVSDFIFLGFKITVDGDCSHEIKRRLLLGRKVMTNLDSILKSRDIMLPTNFRLVKAMVFLVVMCRCESWTVKKAE